MAALSAQKITSPSLTPVFSAVAAADNMPTGENTFLYVKNGGGSPDTVTIAAYPDTAPWGAAIPDLTVSVAAGTERIIPLTPSSFANPADGRAYATHSFTTSVTCAVITT